MFLKKLEHKFRNELWARRLASILSDSKLSDFFCRVSLKIAKNGEFWLFTKLLEILIWNIISRVPPCEASRPDDSENVVVFGPRSF